MWLYCLVCTAANLENWIRVNNMIGHSTFENFALYESWLITCYARQKSRREWAKTENSDVNTGNVKFIQTLKVKVAACTQLGRKLRKQRQLMMIGAIFMPMDVIALVMVYIPLAWEYFCHVRSKWYCSTFIYFNF